MGRHPNRCCPRLDRLRIGQPLRNGPIIRRRQRYALGWTTSSRAEPERRKLSIRSFANGSPATASSSAGWPAYRMRSAAPKGGAYLRATNSDAARFKRVALASLPRLGLGGIEGHFAHLEYRPGFGRDAFIRIDCKRGKFGDAFRIVGRNITLLRNIELHLEEFRPR